MLQWQKFCVMVARIGELLTILSMVSPRFAAIRDILKTSNASVLSFISAKAYVRWLIATDHFLNVYSFFCRVPWSGYHFSAEINKFDLIFQLSFNGIWTCISGSLGFIAFVLNGILAVFLNTVYRENS